MPGAPQFHRRERTFLSLCDVCLREVPTELAGDAWIEYRKRCPEHGERRFPVSRNGEAFLKLDRGYHLLFPEHEPISPRVDTYFFLTNRCNQSCDYCLTEANHHPYFDEYDLSSFEDSLRSYRGRKVSLIGGEPLMHPRFFDFLAAIRRHGRTAVVYTNGVAFANEAVVRRMRRTAGRLEVRMTFEGSAPDDYAHLPGARLREKKLAALAHLEKHRVSCVLGHTIVPGQSDGDRRRQLRALIELAMARPFIRGFTFQGAMALGGARHLGADEVLSVDRVMDHVVDAMPIPYQRREAYLAQRLVHLVARVFDLPMCSFVQAAPIFRVGGGWVGLAHLFDLDELERRLDARMDAWQDTRRQLPRALASDLARAARPGRLPSLLRLGLQTLPVFLRDYDFANVPPSVLPLVSITVCDRHNYDASVARRCEKATHTRVDGQIVQETCSEMVIRHLRERTASEGLVPAHRLEHRRQQSRR